MFPAIERRSGRSRYASATFSSSSTATRCSPTSTEISSSRFAGGSGGRLGGGGLRGARCFLRGEGRRSGGAPSFFAGSGFGFAACSLALGGGGGGGGARPLGRARP